MSIKICVTDGDGSNNLLQLEERDKHIGAKVFTEPLRVFQPDTRAFVSPIFGINMNIDARFTGTPKQIHNGTDATLWTGTSIVGTKFTFDSTDQANNGTKSVKINNPSIGDTMQFAFSGSVFDAADFNAATMFINVQQNWDASSLDSIEIYGWNTVTGMQVGDAVVLERFFSEQITDQWLKLGIPLSDMGLDIAESNVDAFRVEVVAKSGQSPLWYMDDFQLEETGADALFTVTPDPGTLYRVGDVIISMADAFPGTVTDGTMPGIPFDSYLGVPALDGGIIFTINAGDDPFQFSFRQLSDGIDGGATIEDAISDGTNTYFKTRGPFPTEAPFILDSRRGDSITIRLIDDWSGLLHFRVFLHNGRVEMIE